MSTRYAVEHRTVTYVSGPLIVADAAVNVAYGDLVEVVTGTGDVRRGQVLQVEGTRMVVQVLDGTGGLDLPGTAVRSRAAAARLGVTPAMVGRVLDGSGRPTDGGPPLLPLAERDLAGLPLSPVARDHPADVIETGVSAIDGLTTLVRGQKLPIFSGAGLPAGELVLRLTAGARVTGDDAAFVVVLAAIGITEREAEQYRARLSATGALEHTVVFSTSRATRRSSGCSLHAPR